MTNSPEAKPVHQESTYQMLVESEEKGRTLVEDIVYLLLVVATTTTIWQFSRQPLTFVDLGATQTQTAVELGT